MGCLAFNCVLLIDCLAFVIGAVVLGVAIYILAAYGYFEVLLPVHTVYISLAVGLVLMFIGILGCWSSFQAKRGYKTLIYCYLVVVAVCLAANIASFVLFNQLGGLVVTQERLVSGALVLEREIELNNALLSTYTACCTGCPDGCNNAQPFFNRTLNNCYVDSVFACAMVPTCSGTSATEQGCYVMTENSAQLLPPVTIDVGVCNAFSKIEIDNNGTYLVGSIELGACGNGDPAVFSDNVLLYFAGMMQYVNIALGVLCGFQALNLIMALCVTFSEGGRERYY